MTTLPASASSQPHAAPARRTIRSDRAVLIAVVTALLGAGGGHALSGGLKLSDIEPLQSDIRVLKEKVSALERDGDKRDTKFDIMLDRLGRVESTLTQIQSKIESIARNGGH